MESRRVWGGLMKDRTVAIKMKGNSSTRTGGEVYYILRGCRGYARGGLPRRPRRGETKLC